MKYQERENLVFDCIVKSRIQRIKSIIYTGSVCMQAGTFIVNRES